MPPSLDQLLNQLAAQTSDHRLAQIEPKVWARIVGGRALSGRGLWGWRAATAAAMLMVGALASGAAARPVSDNSPFAVHAALAPSTLLESRR